MKTVRFGAFETNSSSTHSLIICTDEEYNRWYGGEMVIDKEREKIVSMPSDEELKEDRWRYMTRSDYEYLSMDTFHKKYTTKSGDKIRVFGWYGYDG